MSECLNQMIRQNATLFFAVLNNYHDYNANEKIGENEMTKENKGNGKPLAVWADF